MGTAREHWRGHLWRSVQGAQRANGPVRGRQSDGVDQRGHRGDRRGVHDTKRFD